MRPILVGQAPSKTTDGTDRRPFTGRSGARLQELLDAPSRVHLVELLDLRNLLGRWPGHTNGNGHGKRDGRRRHGGDHFPWKECRRKAEKLWDAVALSPGVYYELPRIFFAGHKVAECFGTAGARDYEVLKMRLLTWRGRTALVAILPHPSGINHFWNTASNRRKARRFLQSACALKINPGGRKWPALKR